MKKQLYIFFGKSYATGDDAWRWIVCDSAPGHLQQFQGGAAELSSQAIDAEVTVVVPGEYILMSVVQLPGKQRQRLLQALPFALEDQLIGDIDDLHFILGEKLEGDFYQSFTVQRAMVSVWLAQLADMGLNADNLIADYQLLDLLNDGVRVVCNEQRCVIAGAGHGMSISRAQLDHYIKRLVNQTENISSIECTGAELDMQGEPAVVCEPQGQVSLQSELVKKRGKQKPVNLLQGEFRQEKKTRLNLRIWYPAAAVLLIWFLLQSFMLAYSYIGLRIQQDKLNDEIVALYRKTFPEAKHVRDPRRQMEANLKRLRGDSAAGDSDFNHLFVLAARDMSKFKQFTIQSVRYREGRVLFELELESLQALDELKQILLKHEGWQVEVQNAAAEKNIVKARLEIRVNRA